MTILRFIQFTFTNVDGHTDEAKMILVTLALEMNFLCIPDTLRYGTFIQMKCQDMSSPPAPPPKNGIKPISSWMSPRRTREKFPSLFIYLVESQINNIYLIIISDDLIFNN